MLFCAIWEQPWTNIQQFNEKRSLWVKDTKPETFKVIGEYSLQGPTSKGVIIFETDKTEDVNLFRNYFALAGVTMDIRVTVDLETSIEVIERLQARW